MPRLAWPHRALAWPLVGPTAASLAVASTALFGFVGVGRGGGAPFGFDGRFLQVAGAMWLRGANPYSATAFEAAARAMGAPSVGAAGFAYPPTAAPLAMLLGAMSFRAGAVAIGLLNVLAAMAVVTLVLRLLPAASARRVDVQAFVVVAVFASPFVQHVFWMGQTTLLALAALLGGWYAGVSRGRTLLGGTLLALSTLKPQLVVFSLAWLLVERRWLLSVATAAAASVMALPSGLASHGPVSVGLDWVHALTRYAGGPVQTASFQHVFGVRSLLVLSGLAPASSVAAATLIVLLAVVSLALLWGANGASGANAANGTSELGVPALTLALSVLLVYAHDYDLAVLSPLFVFAWVEAEHRPAAATFVVFAMAALFVPQRLLRGIEGVASRPWILHWREVVGLAMVALCLLRLLRSARVGRAGGVGGVGGAGALTQSG